LYIVTKLSQAWVKVEDRLRHLYKDSELTIRNYRVAVSKFQEWMNDRDYEGVTTKDILDYLVELGKGYNINTVKLHYHALKTFFTILGKADIDWRQVRLGDVQREYRILPEEDITKIIDTAYRINVKYGLMLQTGYECALRVSELCDLKVEDFNYTECTITVRALKKGYVQSIPISKDLCINLKEYLNKEKPKKYLFETKYKNKWNTVRFTEMFNKVVDEAGPYDIHYHEFARHSRATNLLKAGVDLYTVNRLLRHKLLETTSVYLHYTANDLREKLKVNGNEARGSEDSRS